MIYNTIEINLNQSDCVFTKGLASNKIINKEIKIWVKNRSKEEYIETLKYLIDYVISADKHIKENQTISYYSWVLKLVYVDGFLEVWEADERGDLFIEGCDYSLKLIQSQVDICKTHNTYPIFPTFSQNIIISNGVYEGMEIDAVRYESPNNMCGWWLITDLYDDNPKSLKNVHFYHVAFKRPEILKCLALPFGYRFYFSSDDIEIWFDEDVVNDE